MLIELKNENAEIEDDIVDEIIILKNGKPVITIQNYDNHKLEFKDWD